MRVRTHVHDHEQQQNTILDTTMHANPTSRGALRQVQQVHLPRQLALLGPLARSYFQQMRSLLARVRASGRHTGDFGSASRKPTKDGLHIRRPYRLSSDGAFVIL